MTPPLYGFTVGGVHDAAASDMAVAALSLFSLPAHAIVYWYVLYHSVCRSPARTPHPCGLVYDATDLA